MTAVSLGAEADGRWDAGDAVEVVLRFAEPVAVEGAPSVGLVLEGAVRRAAYVRDSGTDALTFRYTLAGDDGPWSRAALAGDSLRLDGGSILSAGGGLEAVLTHPAASRTLEAPPVAPALGVADAAAPEGGRLAFVVRLDKAAGREVTVDYATADGTAAAGADYTAASGTLAFAAGEREKTVEVAALADAATEGAESFTLALSNASGATIADGAATGTVSDVTPRTGPALTAAFVGMPAEHDGRKLFSFEIRFDREFRGLRLPAFKAGALVVTNGRLIDAKRVVPGENRRVTVRVRPAGFEDVTVTLPAATDCAAPGAVCTEAGGKLSNTVTATVMGPALLSVADARAREGIDPAVEFEVSPEPRRLRGGDGGLRDPGRDGRGGQGLHQDARHTYLRGGRAGEDGGGAGARRRP